MPKALIVEDNKLIGSLVKQELERRLNFESYWVETFREAVMLLDAHNDFSIALLDIILPDAPDGEVIDYALARNIPVIVFTGDKKGEWQDRFWDKKIVDYVLKDGPDKLDYISSLINRLEANKSTKVMVVDNSGFSRDYVCNLLRIHNYQVFSAVSGEEALQLLEENPDIRLMITDYHMAGMDGFDLIRRTRRRFNREMLAIIGIAGQDDKKLPARFIKNGANDFLTKPFMVEEFYCRVNHNIQTLRYIQTIREISYRDYLTGLYNRRYFFETASHLFNLSSRQQKPITVAMLDIDFFKKVNDTCGHETGDVVLREIAALLKDRFRGSDIVARFGGEEFCIFANGMDKKHAIRVFDQIRKDISTTAIVAQRHRVSITVSIGSCSEVSQSLDEMIKYADDMLYQAKISGRNTVLAI